MNRNRAVRTESIIVGIDVGTTKITAVIAGIDKDFPEILGFAKIPFEASILSDPDMTGMATTITADAISWAVRVAYTEANCSTPLAIVGISGIAKSCNSEGIVAVNGKVSHNDIQKTIVAASDFTMPKGLVMLDQIINSFSLNLDDIEGIHDPLGMVALNLGAVSHNILGRKALLDLVTAGCSQAGINVLKMTSSELAAAGILLTSEEKQNGVCLLDIGGDYTSLVVYHAGALKYTASVPWGGNHITDLIKFRLGVNVTKAERAKLAFSRGILNDEQSTAIRKLLDRELLVLCSHLDTELSKSGLEDELASGIALTGGTCKLPSLADALERVLQMPVRHAKFPTNQWLNNISADYASAVGLILRRISLFGAPA
ncbi:MAG: pilus assembly protein PilM [Deltaproteobacteria bacterium]|nr:pilus assembly protein PilM [Deltaproteobacteria bacterium]